VKKILYLRGVSKKPYCNSFHKILNTEKSTIEFEVSQAKEWLFVAAVNPANYPFVTAVTQSFSFQ
tara:strand:- start:49 stop:243 length:195 start_codon:yes stop_codon:yes gene_type:complete